MRSRRFALLLLLALPLTALAAEISANLSAFQQAAEQEFGARGRKAADFLITSMPAEDRKDLSADFLLANLRLAFAARDRFPWAKDAPENLFLNDVLPYAVLDETREPWRKDLLARAEKIVAGCATAGEAAQALNRDLFNEIKVHYNTNRKRPNQSPSESIAQGRATCTGLAIILVDACRAVGIPARVAGVAEWTTKPGNHTWVEIWDGEWKFLGADEHDPQGLNRGWFVGDAAKARTNAANHAVWASSWKPADGHFPLVWAPKNTSIPAENVTARYATAASSPKNGRFLVHLRVRDSSRADGDNRIAVVAELRDATGRVIATKTTNAGSADLNHTADFEAAPGEYVWRLSWNGETRETPLKIEGAGEQLVDLDWRNLPPAKSESTLSRDQARKVAAEAWRRLQSAEVATREKELSARQITRGDKTIRWKERVDGKKPANGYALWISLHGGGGTTKEVNDSQYSNHINLYAPTDGIWVAPRSPTDAWDMWHQAHIDPLFTRIIEDYVIARGVDPNRVYLLGYSAGGDGVYQLAPRMADRFAAAGMMAGHPNEASPLGLRNLPFAIFVGGDDAAYRRNEIAAEWGQKLDALQKNDPAGYPHQTRIYPGLGHWMNRRDAEALPWMTKFERNPWPKKIAWYQDDVTHDRFYWLAVPAGSAKPGQTVTAEIKGQTIEISTDGLNALDLNLSDALLDLDKPATVTVNGRQLFRGTIPRTERAIRASLLDRADPAGVATASLSLRW